eukprot:gene5996-7469_t
MKGLAILATFLLAIAFVSAGYPYPCGRNYCKFGEICHTLDDVCNCIPIQDCRDVTLTTKFIGQWEDGTRGGRTFTQYDVIITNHLGRDITQIYIGSDATLCLRDGNAIWNVNRLPNGVLTLPSYQPSINANASFTFGFIIEGTHIPNLWVIAVKY